MNINYKEKLLEIYNNAISTIDIENEITEQDKNYILEIGSKCKSQKGVYTVLVTLLIYKILNPQQDIRYHQSNMPSGFSGRGIDTQYITPTLKQLGLPAMAESGWLTRSLEQPYPYTLNYEGKINDKNVGALEIASYSLEQLGAFDRALPYYESLHLLTGDNFSLYKSAYLQYSMKRYAEAMNSLTMLMKVAKADEKIAFAVSETETQQVDM